MNTPNELAPDVLARALEDRGFDSLWIGEHSHIPVATVSPYPDGELPEPYLEMMDPFVSLAIAAHATTTLLVGTGVALPLEHDLLALAKSAATLDRFSGGRFQFGVGVGWNAAELANHAPIPWGARYRAVAEAVAALRVLWRDGVSEFHGEYFSFPPLWSRPKPLQAGGPPVWYGAAGRIGTGHTVEWADGWMPMDLTLGAAVDIAYVDRKVARFRAACADGGRGEVPISLVVMGDPTAATLEHYRAIGVDRVVLGGGREGWADGSSTLAFLDRYAALAAG